MNRKRQNTCRQVASVFVSDVATNNVCSLQLPQYPVQRPDQLRFPRPNSRELAEREEHIHDHLPPMNPEWDGGCNHESITLSFMLKMFSLSAFLDYLLST